MADEGSKVAVPQINLLFNYPIKPENLKEKLRIEVDGNEAAYSVQTLSTGNNVVVQLANFKSEDKPYEAKVILEKGLKPEGGNNSTEEELKTLLSIPSPYVLNINDVQSEHDGTEGIVRIGTSQQLTNEGLTSLIKFEPAVTYRVEHSRLVLRYTAINSTPKKVTASLLQKDCVAKLVVY